MAHIPSCRRRCSFTRSTPTLPTKSTNKQISGWRCQRATLSVAPHPPPPSPSIRDVPHTEVALDINSRGLVDCRRLCFANPSPPLQSHHNFSLLFIVLVSAFSMHKQQGIFPLVLFHFIVFVCDFHFFHTTYFLLNILVLVCDVMLAVSSIAKKKKEYALQRKGE